MKTIKLRLSVQDEVNPVLVDDANNIVVPTINMVWVVDPRGIMIDPPAALIAEYMGRILDVQVHDSGELVTLKNKAIIIL